MIVCVNEHPQLKTIANTEILHHYNVQNLLVCCPLCMQVFMLFSYLLVIEQVRGLVAVRLSLLGGRAMVAQVS